MYGAKEGPGAMQLLYLSRCPPRAVLEQSFWQLPDTAASPSLPQPGPPPPCSRWSPHCHCRCLGERFQFWAQNHFMTKLKFWDLLKHVYVSKLKSCLVLCSTHQMTNPWKELQWLPMEILTLCLGNLFTTQLSWCLCELHENLCLGHAIKKQQQI